MTERSSRPRSTWGSCCASPTSEPARTSPRRSEPRGSRRCSTKRCGGCSSGGRMTQNELGRSVGMPPANIHSTVRRLLASGLVATDPSPTDKRVTLVGSRTPASGRSGGSPQPRTRRTRARSRRSPAANGARCWTRSAHSPPLPTRASPSEGAQRGEATRTRRSLAVSARSEQGVISSGNPESNVI